MRPVLLVPGIQNSGPGHWQSLWEARHPAVTRVTQRDWERPVCSEWVQALDVAVRQAAAPPIVVAHSLGCLVVAHWATHVATHGAAQQSRAPAHAALLVAVPDPLGPVFPGAALGFAPVPRSLAGLRATVASSSDDPYASPQYTEALTADWNVEHWRLGAKGHLNAASGLGDWPEAWARVAQWRQA